jgi:hypothetical protein
MYNIFTIYIMTGTLDPDFRTGKVTTDFNGGTDSINSIAIDANGKIVVGGISGNDFALARYFGEDDYQNN